MEPDRTSFLHDWNPDNMKVHEDDSDEEISDEEGPEKNNLGEESRCFYSCFCICDYDTNKSNDNLIPGEIKVSSKFRMIFLHATTINHYTGVAQPAEKKTEEAEKAFTQIYQYMNKLGAHYGYLITNKELICIRRRNASDYGTMDISGSIPLSVEEGKLNAKLALWYLHHRYVLHDPTQTTMPTTPKKANWPTYVNTINSKRKQEQDAEFKEAVKKARYQKSRERNGSRTNLRSRREIRGFQFQVFIMKVGRMSFIESFSSHYYKS
jgi:hypothetical protein